MNVELTYKEVWATLNALDLSEYHDKKGNFTKRSGLVGPNGEEITTIPKYKVLFINVLS